MGQQKKTGMIAAAIVGAVVIGGASVGLYRAMSTDTPDAQETDTGLRFSNSVTVIDDADRLADEVDQLFQNAEEQMALSYKNEAYSDDGKTFTCYIANSDANSYNMFIALCTDPELTDMIYVSDLMRPGTAFEEITLENPLDEGSHKLYLVMTQVEDDLKTIHGQVTVTVNWVVL